MNILINSINCGLGNQGGTYSIIMSANILTELGHNVTIIDTVKNQHTWVPLKANHKIIKNKKDVPNSDVIIATGFNTYENTINLPDRCGKKFVWVRGFELWKASENNLVKILSNNKINKIVNSIGLQKKLEQYNIKSNVIYPGYDFDKLYPLNIRSDKKIIIGGLYNTRHITKRTEWIINAFNFLKNNYKNLELWMFGTNKLNNNLITKYFNQPEIKIKNEMYNNIHIWLSPSNREGLHIPPAEAMLTECCIVGVDSELCGTKDYLTKDTGFISDNNFKSFILQIKNAIEDKQSRTLFGKNGRSKILKIGDRKTNMEKMINLFKESI